MSIVVKLQEQVYSGTFQLQERVRTARFDMPTARLFKVIYRVSRKSGTKRKYVIHDRFVSGANNIDELKRTQTHPGTQETHRGY